MKIVILAGDNKKLVVAKSIYIDGVNLNKLYASDGSSEDYLVNEFETQWQAEACLTEVYKNMKKCKNSVFLDFG